MSKTVDSRVVTMKFDNAQFQKGVSSTMSMLDSLKAKLNLGGAAKGIDDLSRAGKNFSLAGMGAGVDAISAKFSALSVVGVAALGTLVSKATSAGTQLVKSLTLDPVMQGFGEYELKMKSIQTVLANTARHGTSLETVNSELDKLNEYADKTIYNFAEMTKNASLFTASGMKIEDATTVIKGFSNAAASSGTGAQEAAGAAYQLSQALNTGYIKLMDWKSLQNAGMGNKNMQDSLIETATAMGTFNGNTTSASAATENFNGSLETGWLTADVMSTYLKAMSGDMTDAEFAAAGFSEAQVAALKAQAAMGLDAATKVRTLSGLMGTLKESVASGWAESFEIIFGNFNEATELFSGVSDVIGGMLSKSAEGRNKLLSDWKEMGGRTALIDAIKNSFNALMSILGPIREAFTSIFPPMTGERLVQLTNAVRDFTAKLGVGKATAENIKSTFEGLFSIFKVGISIVTGIAKAFFAIFSTVGEAGGGLLVFTAGIGEVLTAIQRFLSYTGIIEKFFMLFLSPLLIIKPLIGLISDLAVAISALFRGDISGFGEAFKQAFSNFGDAFDGIRDKIAGFASGLGDSFKVLGRYFEVFGRSASESGNTAMAGFANAFAAISKFFSDFSNDARGTIENLVMNITGGFSRLASGLSAFASDARSKGNEFVALLATMAAAVTGFFSDLGQDALGGLTDAIDSVVVAFQKLSGGLSIGADMTGVSSGIQQASGSLSALGVVGTAVSTVWNGIAGMFSGIGNAIGPVLSELSAFFETLIRKIRGWIDQMDMSDAVSVLNTGVFIAMYLMVLSFVRKMKGLVGDFGDLVTGITDTFGQLTDTLKTMQQNVRANIILKIAIAVGVLVVALYVLSELDADKLKQGLMGLAAVFTMMITALVVITKFGLSDTGGVVQAGAMMLLLAIAVRILASAVTELSALSWEEMIKGLVAVGALLGALTLFSKFAEAEGGGIKAGVGLVLLAVAIRLLAESVAVLGAMDTGQLIKGVLALGIMVAMLGGVTKAMSGATGMIPAAAAMVILAGALLLLSVAIRAFAAIDLVTFATGLLMMAATLKIVISAMNALPNPATALAGAAAIAIVAGAMIVLSGALRIMGAMSLEEIAKSLIVLALSLTAIVVAVNAMTGGIAGAAAMVVVAAALAILAPVLVLLGSLSWETLLKGIAGLALVLGVIVVAMYALTPVVFVLTLFAGAIQTLGLAMLAAGAGMALFAGGIALLAVVGGAGFAVLVAGIVSFLNLLPLIAQQFGHAIVAMAVVLGESAEEIIDAFVKIFDKFLEAIDEATPKIIKLVGSMLMAFVDEVKVRAPQIFAAGLDMILGFLNAIKERIFEITQTAIEIVMLFLAAIDSRLGGIIAKGVEMIISFIEGLTKAIRDNKERLGESARGLAVAIIEGMVAALVPGAVIQKIAELAHAVIKKAKEVLGINSPSTIFTAMGGDLVRGLVNGIGNFMGQAASKAREMATSAIKAAKGAITDAASIGKAIVDGMIRGISNGLSAVKTAATNLAKNALNSAKSFLGIASPSKEFEKVGKFVNEGFVKGLTKDRESVKAAYQTMSDLLEQAFASATESIKKHEEKLDDLTFTRDKNTESLKQANAELAKDGGNQGAQNRIRDLTRAQQENAEAIKETEAALAQARTELAVSGTAHRELTQTFKDEMEQLDALAFRYEKVTERLDNAKKALEDAKKLRDSYNDSITDQYDNAPALEAETKLVDYVEDLKVQIRDTKEFTAALDKLRDLGLNDQTYKELLAEGIDAIPFVNQLLEGGIDAINEVNTLTQNLQAEAKKLGKKASKSLYEAGVQTAQGLVNALKDRQSSVVNQMEELARAMLNAMKKELGIKSPSREFNKLGKFSVAGMVQGLMVSSSSVEKAAGDIGTNALVSLRDSLSDISSIMLGDVDMDPVIRPILDLTDIQKNASKMEQLLGTPSIAVDKAYLSAANASAGYRNNQMAVTDVASSAPVQGNMTFVQNNNSPKALTSAEIYRQTKNQLSVVKRGALTP